MVMRRPTAFGHTGDHVAVSILLSMAAVRTHDDVVRELSRQDVLRRSEVGGERARLHHSLPFRNPRCSHFRWWFLCVYLRLPSF